VADAPAASVLVIGLGNEVRGDDGAGIAVARRLRGSPQALGLEVRALSGEPTELLEAWEATDAVVLVDTMRSGAPVGTVRTCDASANPLPEAMHGCSSTHALGLREAIELGRAIDRLPGHVVICAVEGRSFAAGEALSPEVDAAITILATEVISQARWLERLGTAGGHGQPSEQRQR
jgi:hydrogenase maturation protease